MKQSYIIVSFTLVLFVLTMKMSAQTMVTLETNREVKITIPQDYELIPLEEDDDGPYKQWTHCRLWAKNQDHIIFVYTIVIEMPKEGKELLQVRQLKGSQNINEITSAIII